MSEVGEGIQAGAGNWSFSGKTVEEFEGHIGRSVPLYKEGHSLICDISDFFIKQNSIIYELGCATGRLTKMIAEHNKHKTKAKFIGLDVEEDMINYANSKLNDERIEFHKGDVVDYEYERSDFIIAYYTFQFLSPSKRQSLFNRLYESLNWGGCLILFEKVRGSDARFQDIMTSLYTDFKLRAGYTPEQIIGKSRSLKGVLEPYSSNANIDMMKRAGFEDINTIFKYICFEGFIAIK